MKAYLEFALALLWIGMLLAIDQFLGRRVGWFAVGLSATWFGIALILASRPPGIPELVSDEVGSDEQHILRRDILPKLPWPQRVRLALSVACGSCLLLWLSLAITGQ